VSIVDPNPNNPTINVLEAGVLDPDGRIFVIKYQAVPAPTLAATTLSGLYSTAFLAITLGGDSPLTIPVGVLYTED
jgi:hypothetical protein